MVNGSSRLNPLARYSRAPLPAVHMKCFWLCMVCMKELGMERIGIHDSRAMAMLSERIKMCLGHSRRAEGPDGMAKHIRNTLV